MQGIPLHIWMVGVLAVLDGLLALATFMRVPLGSAGDGMNFQLPLAVFGGLATLAWSDAARRIAGVFLT